MNNNDAVVFDFNLFLEYKHFILNAQCRSSAKRLAIIGASGSGKSLLLQMIAGIKKPNKGHLIIYKKTFIHTETAQFVPAQQRKIGFVFQDYALFPHLTVMQNIAFGLQHGLRNPSKKIMNEQIQFWLEKMQLTSVANQYPNYISGGQKQRTALARACIIQPHCLLLDEPFSALDADLRIHMRETVDILQKELNIPILLVSHDKADVDVLADDIWHMQSGQLCHSPLPLQNS